VRLSDLAMSFKLKGREREAPNRTKERPALLLSFNVVWGTEEWLGASVVAAGWVRYWYASQESS
jgi:hypothetical protein